MMEWLQNLNNPLFWILVGIVLGAVVVVVIAVRGLLSLLENI